MILPQAWRTSINPVFGSPFPSVTVGAVPSAMVPALPEVQTPAAAPALNSAKISESVLQPGSQERLSPEKVSELSAKVFDGKAEAPVVQVPETAAFPAAAPQAPVQVQTLGSRVFSRPVRLIITGPPGSGKGTYSKLLSKDYGVPHISVGELLRAHARTHPEVAALMAQGRLVDTGLVLAVVRERLAQPDVKERGFILDGFPRRVVEARALKAMLGPEVVDAVIALDVSEPELLRRILARGRPDDTAEAFQERMRIYREDTVPAAAMFRSAGKVLAPEVTASSAETNYARLKAEFEAWAESAGLKTRPKKPRAR